MKELLPIPTDYLEYRARARGHHNRVYMWTGIPGEYRHIYRAIMRCDYFYKQRALYVRNLELIRQIDGWRWDLPDYGDVVEDCLYNRIDLEALFFMNVPPHETL